MFWETTGVGDGPLAGYTAGDFYNFLRRLLIPNHEADQGVLRGVGNELVVSGIVSPLTVATGAGIVYGLFYENGSPLSLAVGIPITGITGGRVNLKADWAAQTIRAVVQLNTDGVADIPALVQTAGSEWNIPLATFTINQAGQIALASAREFCQFAEYLTADLVDELDGLSVVGRSASTSGAAAAIAAANDGEVLRLSGGVLGFGQVSALGIADGAVTQDKIAANAIGTTQIQDEAVTAGKIADDTIDDTKLGNRVAQFYRRQGGNASDWSSQGSNNYTPGAVRMQSGIINGTINPGSTSGSITVTFPVAFSDKPLVYLTIIFSTDTFMYAARAINIAADQFVIVIHREMSTGTTTFPVCWLAIGPE